MFKYTLLFISPTCFSQFCDHPQSRTARIQVIKKTESQASATQCTVWSTWGSRDTLSVFYSHEYVTKEITKNMLRGNLMQLYLEPHQAIIILNLFETEHVGNLRHCCVGKCDSNYVTLLPSPSCASQLVCISWFAASEGAFIEVTYNED